MPIYEYKCSECGFRFEELILKSRKIKCHKCGSFILKKLISKISCGENNHSDSTPCCSYSNCR